MYNNALYIQSGGPTAVINASACGVIRACREHSSQIHTLYASIHGVRGLIDNHLINLKNFTEKRLARFRRTPGMAFGSCRYKVNESPESDDYERICQTIREHQIGFVFLNGGNGSAAAALRLSDALERNNIPCKLIVIPKTVDNDILGIDHAPGYPSAARHVALTVAELSHDLVTFDKDLIMVVEVMGRNTGFLAAAALASGTIGRAPDLIYVPEKPFDADTFVKDVQAIMHERGKCLAVVSEGIRDSEGRYLFEHFSLNAGADPSRNMGGVSLYLGNLLREHFPCKIRCIDLNLMQRCSGHDAVELDRDEAEQLGSAAVEAALEGHTRQMVSLKRIGSQPYRTQLERLPLEAVTAGDQTLALKYITNHGIQQSFLEYLLPIIGPLPDYLPQLPELL